jgi:hypothetical protein
MRKKTFRLLLAKEILESRLASRILGGWHAGPEQAAMHMARTVVLWRMPTIALAQKILGLHFLSFRNLA